MHAIRKVHPPCQYPQCDRLSAFRCLMCQRCLCSAHMVASDHRCNRVQRQEMPTLVLTDSTALMLVDELDLHWERLQRDLTPTSGRSGIAHLVQGGYEFVINRVGDGLYYYIRPALGRSICGPFPSLRLMFLRMLPAHRTLFYPALLRYGDEHIEVGDTPPLSS